MKITIKISLWCFVFIVTNVCAQGNSEFVFGTCGAEYDARIAVDPVTKHQYLVNISRPVYTDRAVVTKMNENQDILWSKFIYLDSSWQSISASSITWMDTTLAITGIASHYDPTTDYFQWKVFVSHFNTNGDLLWTKYIHDSPTSNVHNEVNVTYIDDQIIVTSSYGSLVQNTNVIITALSQNGTVLWSKSMDDLGRITAVESSPDGNLIVTGGIYEYSSDLSTLEYINPFLLKLDNSGTVLWKSKYLIDTLVSKSALPFSIDFIASDSSILIGGKADISDSIAGNTGYTGRFSLQNGAVIWSKAFVSNILYRPFFNKVITGNNSNYLVGSGKSENNLTFGRDIVIAKIQESGTIDWMYSYGANGVNDNVDDVAFFNNNLVLVGTKLNPFLPSLTGQDIYHLTVRPSGEASNKLDTLSPVLTDFVLTQDTSINFSAGYSLDSVAVFHDSLVDYNLDTLACLFLGIETVESGLDPLYLFPNPASDVVSIQLIEAMKNEEFEITIINSIGKEVFKTNSSTFSVHDLQIGMYFVKIISHSNQWVSRLEIIR